MAVYYVDANELDGIATATSNARNELWWSLRPIDAVAWAVPWPGDTRAQWERVRHIIDFELGWLDNDARSLRDRAHKARREAFFQTVMELAPLWVSAFPLVPLPITIGVLGLGTWSAIGAKSSEAVSDPEPAQPTPKFAIIDSVTAARATPLQLFAAQTGHLDDGRGNYPGECVSLVKNYMRTKLHEPGDLTFRNGGPNWEWDDPQAFVPARWEKISATEIPGRGGYQAGDIVFFNWGRGTPPAKHTYQGHIGVVVGVNSATGEVLVYNQNSPRGAQATIAAFKATNFVGVMRRK